MMMLRSTMQSLSSKATIMPIMMNKSIASSSSTIAVTTTSRKMLSTQCESSVRKLREVFEEYRVTHCTQEMPSRVKKDIVKAAAATNDNSSKIEPAGLERVLQNIDTSNKISSSDLSIIFEEFGGNSGAIPCDKMLKLL